MYIEIDFHPTINRRKYSFIGILKYIGLNNRVKISKGNTSTHLGFFCSDEIIASMNGIEEYSNNDLFNYTFNISQYVHRDLVDIIKTKFELVSYRALDKENDETEDNESKEQFCEANVRIEEINYDKRKYRAVVGVSCLDTEEKMGFLLDRNTIASEQGKEKDYLFVVGSEIKAKFDIRLSKYEYSLWGKTYRYVKDENELKDGVPDKLYYSPYLNLIDIGEINEENE